MGKQKSIPDKVCSLLNSGEQLSHLGRMLDKQRALLLAVRSQLPSPLDQHCLYARISGKLLIIHTDSPVWNARLRFHGPQLIRAMQQQAPHLQQLKINIHIDAVHKPPKRRQIKLSKNNAAQILEAADSIDDPNCRRHYAAWAIQGEKKKISWREPARYMRSELARNLHRRSLPPRPPGWRARS